MNRSATAHLRAMTRLAMFGCIALCCALASYAQAQPWPSKTIRLIVPVPPGGSADALARPLAAKLGAALGMSVVVENRPGGLMVIGADAVAKSPPDGYTLYFMPGTHVLIDQMVKDVPFKPMSDFTPVATLGFLPYVVLANAQQPFKTLPQMIEYAKSQPEKVSIGVSDAVTRMAAYALESAAGIKLTIVEYKGGGPVSTDLVGNQIATAIAAANLMPFVQQGKLVALGVTTTRPVPAVPGVRPLAELLPGSQYDVQTWFAIAGPANLPKPIVERLSAEIRKVLADPEMRAKLDGLGMVVPDDPSASGTAQLMVQYQTRMGRLMKDAGIVPQ